MRCWRPEKLHQHPIHQTRGLINLLYQTSGEKQGGFIVEEVYSLKELRSIYCDLDSAVKTLGVLEEMLSETSPPNRYADILYIVCMCMEQISGRVSDYIHTCEQRNI